MPPILASSSAISPVSGRTGAAPPPLAEGAIAPAAAVLVAPMLGLHAPLGWMGLGERIARLLGGAGDTARAAWRDNETPGGKSPRQLLLTHDLGRYADETWWKEAHPELQLGPPSWAWVIEAFRSTRMLRDAPALRTLRVPVLTLIADADRLVSAKAAVATVGGFPDHRIVRFGPEAAHEILREADPVRHRALGEIDRFLSSRAPAR